MAMTSVRSSNCDWPLWGVEPRLKNVSLSTLRSLEAGADGVALGNLLKVLQGLNLLDQVEELLVADARAAFAYGEWLASQTERLKGADPPAGTR